MKIDLPTRIDRKDARSAIVRCEQTLRDDPTARFMVGAVSVDGDQVHIDLAGVDFTATHWAAIADGALEWAAKRLAAAHEIVLLRRVEQARAALSFEEEAQVQ